MKAAALAKDEAAGIEKKTLEDVHGKEHVNSIFIGHGTSTLEGRILYVAGMVYARTMDKYKREAKEAGRETRGR